uniref:glycerol-3-phosphate dehydrogenase n=1 Tax=Macrostomum lignano TaxID=282301 RepID=A0A1I8JNF3_9PLAT
VRWACQEYACRAIDILARRTPGLPSPTCTRAAEALPRVVAIMAEELGWSDEKCREEFKHCKRYLQHEMGYNLKLDSDHRLEPHQIREIIDEVDLNRNGRIEISEFLQHVLGDSSAANYKKPQQDARIPVDRSG